MAQMDLFKYRYLKFVHCAMLLLVVDDKVQEVKNP